MKRMLIDAIHPEEIRVAITQDGRLDEFDFESAARKPLKGNIYLAKVTRVEPSLQAAFVEYGGNRQGFLPFSEIHYDYFHIPVEDKKKLEEMVNEEIEKAQREEDEDEESAASGEEGGEQSARPSRYESDRPIRADFYRKYKIQEVIKRNQILLVQIIKEERGNKGASVTTYVSLPGKYCVLMSNTDRQGGVSRKITDFETRRTLRKIVKGLEMPKGMSIIIRTAGSDRTKAEIKRDFSYLTKLWEKIRANAVASTAPALIYEEGDIIKRSIRDMYDSSIDEVVIEGKTAFEQAKNFMTLITPLHAKKVMEHSEKDPIFWHYEIEDELASLYEVEVPLKSGGYIVLNPTEALVSIDVNSGKATRERSVEETALKTNLEAAHEIARQLKLRDLAGLIVIDFIDMLELRNKKTIERALKDALRKDKAKIQVGRISMFGLLEMSRQRLSSSMAESSTVKCPRCNGMGVVRSKHSGAVTLIREIEHDIFHEQKPKEIVAFTSEELAEYIKQEKSQDIKKLEADSGVPIKINSHKELIGAQFAIGEDALKGLLEALAETREKETPVITKEKVVTAGTPVHQDDVNEAEIGTFENEPDDEDDGSSEASSDERRENRGDREDGDYSFKRRRRGGRRGGRHRDRNFRRRDERDGAEGGGDYRSERFGDSERRDRSDRPRRHDRRDHRDNFDRQPRHEEMPRDMDGNREPEIGNYADGNSDFQPRRPERTDRGGRFRRGDRGRNRGGRQNREFGESREVVLEAVSDEAPPANKEPVSTEVREKERSVIRNLWKKITD